MINDKYYPREEHESDKDLELQESDVLAEFKIGSNSTVGQRFASSLPILIVL